MTITTKIIAAFGILLALMIAILAYQVAMIYRLLTINNELSHLDVRAALVAVELLRLSDLVEENAQKYFLLKDPDYRARSMEFAEEFAVSLQEMPHFSHSAADQAEIDQLAVDWKKFQQVFAEQERIEPQKAFEEVPAALTESLKLLRAQCERVFDITQSAIAQGMETAARTSQRAEIVSWSAALAALAVAGLVSLFMVRSILDPLRQLTAGTKAIAAGRFNYRLDVSGKDEYAQLASDFNRMSERLDELDQMKKDFISHISHELRTPLASLQESINLLLSEIPGPLTDRQRRFLQLGVQSGKRLSGMLSNLLDLSRMEAGVMEYELITQDLTLLVRNVMEELESQVHEKQLQLRVEVPGAPLHAKCDADRVSQVLGNLVGNAIKFSPPGGEITVHLSWEPRWPAQLPKVYRELLPAADCAAGFAVLAVADSGPGISETEKEHIFEKFHQIKGAPRMAGQGAGLGLAISRTIVQAHHGAIWVESNPDGGSIFYVALPIGIDDGEVGRRVSSPV
jgi:two-component system sensor histidine kinase GlrK